ncbi:sulfatase [Roseiconus nitratireducens]|uniref:Sulfatase n=2 Tax=Roseiconus nitratireducens TaxID=2605748 RepID=A0A5M6D8J9_9BACT|nr:sulfatase [Roseiconus nitratireducens]
MVDDLGWRDLHCYGNTQIDTPHIDQLANEGMRFTDAYAASPVCSPTRAAMMTGQTPARLGITNHAPGHPDGFSLEGSDLCEAPTVRHLNLSYTTIAERLKAAGYATAHIGKWHLSHVAKKDQSRIAEQELRPQHQGFDLNIGGTRLGGPPSYFSPYRNDALTDGEEGEYLPDRLAEEAIEFVTEPREEPFFLSWWPFSVHYPLQAPEATIEKYRKRKGIRDPAYAAMIEGVDGAIGRVMKALDDAGMRDDTFVIFKSDNGGYNGDNRPLRGFKGMIFEGGIRIPWIVRWPGVVEAGTTCSVPVISTDCYPTILEVAKLSKLPDAVLDGKSLVPLLKQTGEFERDAIFFHYPNYAFHKRNRLASAVRAGDHKLIRRYDDGSLELYNLKQDLGEKHNLVDQQPELAKQLGNKLDAWLTEVNANLPYHSDAR